MAALHKKWTRLLSSLSPHLAHSNEDVNLSPLQADNLVRYQLLILNSRYLDPLAFFIAGIAASESVFRRMHRTLIKHHIILASPEHHKHAASSDEEGEVEMTVNTSLISRSFLSQMKAVSVSTQRKIVGLLFFWEEECVRWRLLDAEERAIAVEVEMEGGNGDLAIALEAVEMKRRLLPSQRAEGTANVGIGRGDELPGYG